MKCHKKKVYFANANQIEPQNEIYFCFKEKKSKLKRFQPKTNLTNTLIANSIWLVWNAKYTYKILKTILIIKKKYNFVSKMFKQRENENMLCLCKRAKCKINTKKKHNVILFQSKDKTKTMLWLPNATYIICYLQKKKKQQQQKWLLCQMSFENKMAIKTFHKCLHWKVFETTFSFPLTNNRCLQTVLCHTNQLKLLTLNCLCCET